MRHRLPAGGAFARHDVGQPLHEQERRAVRQQFLDLLDVENMSALSVIDRPACGGGPAWRHRMHFPQPFSYRFCRNAAIILSAGNLLARNHGAARRQPGPGADMDMVGDADLAAQHGEILDHASCRRRRPGRPARNGGRYAHCGRSAPDYRSCCPRRSPCRPARRGRWWCRRRSRPRPG